MNKHKLNIHYRGSLWGSWTQQHAYCLRYAHSHHIESHLGKKQPQAKIAITFLFSQLHFNNVTSHALFYGGHLVMCSKRCAVQNQGITLNVFLQYIIISNSLNFFLYDCVTLGDRVNGWSCKINGFSYEVHELRKGRFSFSPSLQTFCCCSLKRSWSIF